MNFHSRWASNWDAQRRKSARQMGRIAELVSEGWTIKAAGREIGVGEGRALKIWRSIKDGLGWQAQ